MAYKPVVLGPVADSSSLGVAGTLCRIRTRKHRTCIAHPDARLCTRMRTCACVPARPRKCVSGITDQHPRRTSSCTPQAPRLSLAHVHVRPCTSARVHAHRHTGVHDACTGRGTSSPAGARAGVDAYACVECIAWGHLPKDTRPPARPYAHARAGARPCAHARALGRPAAWHRPGASIRHWPWAGKACRQQHTLATPGT